MHVRRNNRVLGHCRKRFRIGLLRPKSSPARTSPTTLDAGARLERWRDYGERSGLAQELGSAIVPGAVEHVGLILMPVREMRLMVRFAYRWEPSNGHSCRLTGNSRRNSGMWVEMSNCQSTSGDTVTCGGEVVSWTNSSQSPAQRIAIRRDPCTCPRIPVLT